MIAAVTLRHLVTLLSALNQMCEDIMSLAAQTMHAQRHENADKVMSEMLRQIQARPPTRELLSTDAPTVPVSGTRNYPKIAAAARKPRLSCSSSGSRG